MQYQPLIATFGYDFRLAGWPVWLCAAVGAGLALSLSEVVHLSERVRSRLQPAAPIIMLCFLFLTRLLGSYSSSFFFYKYYHAQLDVAFIISYGFGVSFCIGAMRSSYKKARFLGIVVLVTFLSLLPCMFAYLRSIESWYQPSS